MTSKKGVQVPHNRKGERENVNSGSRKGAPQIKVYTEKGRKLFKARGQRLHKRKRNSQTRTEVQERKAERKGRRPGKTSDAHVQQSLITKGGRGEGVSGYDLNGVSL